MWSQTVPAEGTHRLASGAAAVLALAVLGACATSDGFEKGRTAEQQQDYDRAVVEYTRALKERPDDKNARYALERARVRASQDHFQRGRRLEATGSYEEALLELQLAVELNPSNAAAEELLKTTRLALRNKIAVSREGRTRLETVLDLTREAVPPGLELPRDLRVPASMVFREASSRDVLIALARWANVNITFDPAFRETPITIEFRNSTFEDALASVTATTRNFYRVTAPRTVTIVPDTPAKRREYEEEIVRTFYLSNAELKETIDLLRIVVDARRVAGMAGTNAITIKDSPDRIAAAARVITAIDKARPEVVIDVELLEVDRTQTEGVRPAGGVAGVAGHRRRGEREPRGPHAAGSPVAHAVGRVPDGRPGALLPAAQERHEHADSRQPPAADDRWGGGHGALWRARSRAGHDVCANSHRRRAAAAHHVVQLREHRREHRHHPPHAPQRRGLAGHEGGGEQHLRSVPARPRGCRRSAIASSTRCCGCATARRTCSRASSATMSACS